MSRFDDYQKLCQELNHFYQDGNADFIDCPDCKQANLWTYWQGFTAAENLKNNQSPLILLVGQDWGHFNPDTIAQSIKDSAISYRNAFRETINGSPTDKNLVELFKLLGYDGNLKPTIDTPNSELFFTNLIPGCRKEKGISGFKQSWVNQAVADSFTALVRILRPKIILCLGKNTYEGVMYSLTGNKVKIKTSYNEFLNNQNSPVPVPIQAQDSTQTDCTVPVFALGHCGGMGTANRSRGIFKGSMENDWKKIVPFLR